MYLENDIKLENRIKIISTKSIITIDRTYNNTIHTIEDKKSLNASDTISASYQTTQKVTVKKLNFIGNNYYGIIYVPENQTYKDIIVEYNNIFIQGHKYAFILID